MKRLINKVAIITGAAGGIGAAIAKLFAEEGANVMATDIQEEKLKTWVQAAQENGLSIIWAIHDVTSLEDWQKVVDKTIGAFGHIHILTNNAGVYPAGENTTNTIKEHWYNVIGINLTGPFLGSQVCIPHLKKAKGGSIINISSIAGIVGGNGPAYSASKGGLRLLTKDMAIEFAKDNIRVNSIHPGGVLTPMTEAFMSTPDVDEILKNLCPMQRMGNVMEIAYGALYLASDESTYTTGAALIIDGGLTAR